MGILSTVGAISTDISIAGSAAALATSTKALVTSNKFPPGIAGFLFDIPQETSVKYSAQISDHWLEDNSTVQDHVAIEPLSITCSGIVAELVWTKTALATYAETVLNNLSSLNVLSPSVGLQAAQAIATAETLINNAETVLGQANTFFGLFDGEKSGLNKQQKVFQTFEEIFNSKTKLTVETPYKTYENMIIESFEATQDESTVSQSSFSITFKQIRTVSVEVNTGKLVSRMSRQAAPTVKQGTQPGDSLLSTAGDVLSGVAKTIAGSFGLL